MHIYITIVYCVCCYLRFLALLPPQRIPGSATGGVLIRVPLVSGVATNSKRTLIILLSVTNSKSQPCDARVEMGKGIVSI